MKPNPRLRVVWLPLALHFHVVFVRKLFSGTQLSARNKNSPSLGKILPFMGTVGKPSSAGHKKKETGTGAKVLNRISIFVEFPLSARCSCGYMPEELLPLSFSKRTDEP